MAAQVELGARDHGSSSRVGVLDGRVPRALSDDSLVLHEVVGDRAYAYRVVRVSTTPAHVTIDATGKAVINPQTGTVMDVTMEGTPTVTGKRTVTAR